jgi:Spy/CpxP family protein refolding chaperone
MMGSGYGSGGMMGMMGSGYNSERMMEIMLNGNNLSEKQRAEIFTIMQRRRNSTYKNNLKIREKELALEKKLVADNVDWKAVEKLNKEISDFRAKERLEEMKFIKEIQDKY